MIKKSLSSMAIRKVVEEAQVLKGAFFHKAYQLDYGTIVLRFAVRREQLMNAAEDNGIAAAILGKEEEEGDKEEIEGISLGEGIGNYVKFDLYIKMGGFLFFSSQIGSEMPKDPSSFVMKLRKSLKNRILNDISQVELDRLVVLTFNPFANEDKESKLYLELFGDGNAILVKGDTIEAPFTSKSWSSRTVKRGETFVPPPSGIDTFELSREEFGVRIKASTDDLVRFLIRRVNLPPIHAEEVCFRAGIDKRSSVSGLSVDKIENIWSSLNDLLVGMEREKGAYVHFQRGDPTLIEPCFLSSLFGMRDQKKGLERLSAERIGVENDHYLKMGSMNDAIETYMFEESKPMAPLERKKERAIDKLGKMLKSQEKAKIERERESEGYSILADALYTNYQKIEELLNGFDRTQYNADNSIFPDVVSYTYDRRGGGYIKVRLSSERGEEEVALSLDRTINQNADLLYEMSKRSKRKLDGIKKAINITNEKIKKAEKEIEEMASEDIDRKKLRKFWFENFRWCFSSEGILMIGGRDAKSNERVVKKYMRDTDLYAHADISGASSVVIRVEKDQIADDATKVQGCHFSVLHSKAWNAKIGSTPAYWVIPDQVSRTPQSGEFVAKGSFIIRGKKNMVDKLPLVGAAGTIYVEGVPKVMFGPETAVLKMCNGKYFRIRPGNIKKSDVVKKISAELGGEMEQVMSVLPSDGMDVEMVVRKKE